MSKVTIQGPCCKCYWWRLWKELKVGPRAREVFGGFCRHFPPNPGWPVTLEHDTCSAYRAKYERQETAQA